MSPHAKIFSTIIPSPSYTVTVPGVVTKILLDLTEVDMQFTYTITDVTQSKGAFSVDTQN